MDISSPTMITVLCFLNILHGANLLISDIDKSRYDQGRRHFELMHQNSNMPKYGQCWRDAMVTIETGCRRLDDVVQSRLALFYLNCFLQLQGKPVYPCRQESELAECVQGIADADQASFATFFTHTQDMCYFLQAQVWQEEAERTIGRLEDSSLQVAEQLESSRKLQQDLAESQRQSLKNEEALMIQAQNLSQVISASSQNVQALFENLKNATLEQREIIVHLFDSLLNFQNTVFGEFSGFCCLLYYLMSIFASYLLTSTSRTSGARFWLLAIFTVNMVAEQMLIRWLPSTRSSLDQEDANTRWLYWTQGACRRCSLVLALVVLAVFAYLYQDIDAMNNHLLVEIRKQNSDLRRLVTDYLPRLGNAEKAEYSGTLTSAANTARASRMSESPDSSDSDYTSETSGWDECSDDEQSDRTFILPDKCEETDTSSCHTIYDEEISDGEQEALISEQIERGSNQSVLSWLQGLAGQQEQTSPRPAVTKNYPYNLRPRRVSQSPDMSPMVQVESPSSFTRTVRHMQQITLKNSRLIRAMQSAQHMPDVVPGSSYLTRTVLAPDPARSSPLSSDVSSNNTRSSHFASKH